jgi:hypothetical protein
MEYNIHKPDEKINHGHHTAEEGEDVRQHHLWGQQRHQHQYSRTVAATVLALGLLVVGVAVMVFGAPYRRRTIVVRRPWRTTTTTTVEATETSRQGNFLDASDMVYVDDLGAYLYIYNDDASDMVYVDDLGAYLYIYNDATIQRRRTMIPTRCRIRAFSSLRAFVKTTLVPCKEGAARCVARTIPFVPTWGGTRSVSAVRSGALRCMKM